MISGLLKLRAGSCDECGWGHTKRIRNPKQSFERRLSRATLKHADVGPIDLSCCCQILLRKRRTLTVLAKYSPKRSRYGLTAHNCEHQTLRTIVPRTIVYKHSAATRISTNAHTCDLDTAAPSGATNTAECLTTAYLSRRYDHG